MVSNTIFNARVSVNVARSRTCLTPPVEGCCDLLPLLGFRKRKGGGGRARGPIAEQIYTTAHEVVQSLHTKSIESFNSGDLVQGLSKVKLRSKAPSKAARQAQQQSRSQAPSCTNC